MSGWTNGESFGQELKDAAISGALSRIPGGMSKLGEGIVSVGYGALGGGAAGFANALIFGGAHGEAILRITVMGALLGAGAGVAGDCEDNMLDAALALASRPEKALLADITTVRILVVENQLVANLVV
jgi:hypothetical protein